MYLKKFGFKVIVKENLTHIAMLEEIKKAAMDVTNESSFIVCIMSHGDKGVVYGSNSCKVKVSKIQEIMCKTKNKNLEDKPKILILQSCQGKKCLQLDENSEDELEEETHANTTDGGKSIPPTVDMLIFWATIPGYAAIRNKKTGSWFIQALCKHMEEFGNKHHFSDICTRIMNSMSLRKWINQQDHKNVMALSFESTMRKDFYLPPMKNSKSPSPISSSDSSGSDSGFSSFAGAAAAAAAGAAAAPPVAGAAPTPELMLVIRSRMLTPSKALAKRPGQYGSTSTLAAFKMSPLGLSSFENKHTFQKQRTERKV
ncbi:hypothetical protein NQ317_017703 [Molorchus minor]|uniref:Uncharacterized protein n=1 Tax=Molorchus minor TaxID=1323400 RepID=A0ABQ9JPQ7_9CUCU|nr:hypothetical protein NQ317_017703 [Molorchus minor]